MKSASALKARFKHNRFGFVGERIPRRIPSKTHPKNRSEFAPLGGREYDLWSYGCFGGTPRLIFLPPSQFSDWGIFGLGSGFLLSPRVLLTLLALSL